MNAKQKEAKAFLRQIYRCNAQILDYQKELEELQEMATSIQSPNLKSAVKTTSTKTDAKFVDYVTRIADCQRELEQKMVQILDLRWAVRSVIHQVPDNTLILVLRYRYMDFMKWEDIAMKMDYSAKTIYKWHRAALDAVADILIKQTAA